MVTAIAAEIAFWLSRSALAGATEAHASAAARPRKARRCEVANMEVLPLLKCFAGDLITAEGQFYSMLAGFYSGKGARDFNSACGRVRRGVVRARRGGDSRRKYRRTWHTSAGQSRCTARSFRRTDPKATRCPERPRWPRAQA